MELDDEDLCRWILLANEKMKILESSTVQYVEKLLGMIEEGRDLKSAHHHTLVSLSSRFDKNLKFGKSK